MVKKIRNYLKLVSYIISRKIIHIWNRLRGIKMAYKFSKNESTGTTHIFECNENGLLKSKESICGINHDDHKLISSSLGIIYKNDEEIEIANRALVLFSRGKNLCGRCVGSIYGDVDIN